MKKFFFLPACYLLFFSCKKEDQPRFVIPVPNLNFTVDATFNPFETHYITIYDIPTNALNVLAGNNLDSADVQRIRPFRASLAVVFDDAKLNFIRAISVRICPAIGSFDDNCGTEAFYYEENDQNQKNYDLNLVPSDVKDISDLILQDRVDIQIKMEQLWDLPPGTFDIRLDLEFGVW